MDFRSELWMVGYSATTADPLLRYAPVGMTREDGYLS
jgi:hypothetical protein